MLKLHACLLACALIAACAGPRVREDAQTAMAAGQFEEAVALLEEGLRRKPADTELRGALVQLRGEALMRLLAQAATARAAGRNDQAQTVLERARAFDSAGQRVSTLLADLQADRRQQAALQEAQALWEKKQPSAALRAITEALKENPRQGELLSLQRRIEVDLRQAQSKALQVGLKETRPISLDFRDAGLRTVLDLVTRHSGVNFILDKDVRPDNRVSVYLRGAKLEDAIDLLVSTHQLTKKIVDAQTILIYPNTPDKQREHQEQIVRVFYLANAEAKNAAAFLRSMLKLREPFVDERTNMLSIRDSPENVALAERLISLYDNSEPEVLLEVEVIEVRSSRFTELGIKFPDAFTLTPLAPGGGLTLGNARGINSDRIGLNISGVLFNLRREVGDSNTLANPRIRARNREKARVLIGDKIPVVTTTVGTGGFAAESVNYLDVGLKLEVEPTVYADDDVAIKVNLEVSSVGQQIRTGGTLAFQIGTRSASTLLRLRDGETQLLAGLISRDERMASSRVPGVGDLPLLGRLFSSQLDDNQRTELVLSITPRVLRNLRRPEASETELWVGTEALPRLRPAGALVAGGDEAGAAAEGPAVPPGGPGLRREPAAALGGGWPSPRTPSPTPTQASASLTWEGPSEAKVGDTVALTLAINTSTPLRGGPLRLKLSPAVLSVVGIEEGPFLRQGGAPTSFTHALVDRDGELNVGMLRNDLSGAVGQGALLTLKLKAAKAGDADVSLIGMEPIGLQGAAPAISLPIAWRIKVK